jgi:hypothetical protein
LFMFGHHDSCKERNPPFFSTPLMSFYFQPSECLVTRISFHALNELPCLYS